MDPLALVLSDEFLSAIAVEANRIITLHATRTVCVDGKQLVIWDDSGQWYVGIAIFSKSWLSPAVTDFL